MKALILLAGLLSGSAIAQAAAPSAGTVAASPDFRHLNSTFPSFNPRSPTTIRSGIPTRSASLPTLIEAVRFAAPTTAAESNVAMRSTAAFGMPASV